MRCLMIDCTGRALSEQFLLRPQVVDEVHRRYVELSMADVTAPPALPSTRNEAPTDATPTVEWQAIERSPSSTRLAQDLARRQGAAVLLIGGPAGIGKSHLAGQVAAQLGDAEPVTVRASTGLRDVPLAALAPLLDALGVDVPSLPAQADLLIRMRRALDERPHGLCLVVDDAPRLDAVSAAVVQQLAHHPGVTTILTARDGEPLDDSLAQLLSDGLAEIARVDRLRPSEVTELLVRAFGEQVDPSTVRTLDERSGGNPLFLRELVVGSCAAGEIERGPHGLALRRSVPSARLVDLVSRHFERLPAEQLEVLELLAAAQPLPAAAFDVASEDLIELERNGLVSVDRTACDMLRLGHPVHEEVLRSITPQLRWRDRQRTAARLLDGGAAESRFRSTCLLVDAGDDVAVADLVEASRRAFGLLDHTTAVRLAGAAVSAGAEYWGNLVLGGASSALGHHEQASAALLAAIDAAHDDESRALAAQRWGLHVAIRLERPDDAVEHAEAVLSSIEDPAWRRFLSSDLAKWRLMSGRPVDDLLRVDADSEADGDPEDVAARLNDRVFRALVTVMNGELAAADDAIDEGLPLALAHPEILPNAQDLLRLSRFLSMTFRGDLAEADDFGTAGLRDAVERRGEPEGMWSFALAVMDLHCGRAGSAAARADLAVSRLEWRDFTGLRPVALALSATALAQLGRLGEAAAALGRVDATMLADPKVDMQAAQARAWLAVSDLDVDRAVEELRVAGRRGMDAQHLCLGALTSYEAVRLGGAAAVVDDLAHAADRAEGRLLGALAAHAAAAQARDATGLDEVAGLLDEIGLTLAASDAAAQASQLHRRSGRSEAARRSSRRAQGLADLCDGRRGTSSDSVVVLTPREREVAVLAAQRARSREIATLLGISVRTVDNHLASAYRKLGVVNRDEMAIALDELGLGA